MMKLVFAFALFAPAAALAYQPQPAPPAEAEEAAAAAQPAGEDAAADEVEVDAEEDYRSAVRAYRKCRQDAQKAGAGAATASCASHRKRMLAAKEALREGE